MASGEGELPPQEAPPPRAALRGVFARSAVGSFGKRARRSTGLKLRLLLATVMAMALGHRPARVTQGVRTLMPFDFERSWASSPTCTARCHRATQAVYWVSTLRLPSRVASPRL